MQTGIFTISLDFELHWGVSDNRTVESYEENLRNVPQVIDRLLKLFTDRNIHVTWATVGMLFCRNKQELFSFVDTAHRPTYSNPKLSNYKIAESAGEDEKTDPYHYGSSLVKKIMATKGQEMATHTFSHFYCLEPGQTPDQFYHDLVAAKTVAEREGNTPVSIVFPRNQYNDLYLEQCKKAGVKTYRGNYPSRMYEAEAKSAESSFKRLARLTDTYLPINGNRSVMPAWVNGLLNIPASCFLRPYNKKLSFLEPLRKSRIMTEMTATAKKNKLYHLWWHPHNFGKNIEENFETLTSILDHYQELNKNYGMRSLNMQEILNDYNLK